jgi:hypothetical protein
MLPFRSSPFLYLFITVWVPNAEHSSFIYLYLWESPIRSPPMKKGENIKSPSMEPHVDGRPTYNWVRPGSPRGSLTTLQSLPQGHAAFSTIPSTLAWVDQSPVSQHVSWQPSSGYTLYNCYRFPRDPGYSRLWIHNTPKLGRGVWLCGRRYWYIQGQSIKKPNFWSSKPMGARSMLAIVALCSGDFKLYSDTSSITPRQLVDFL